VLSFIESGGYALRAYDRFKRLTLNADGLWHVTHPSFVAQHRLNAGIIVDVATLDVRFRNGRKLGRWRRISRRSCRRATPSSSPA
jgi:ATP-dependent Lhr-like helicase